MKNPKVLNWINYSTIILAVFFTIISLLFIQEDLTFMSFAHTAFIPAIICYIISVIIVKIQQY